MLSGSKVRRRRRLEGIEGQHKAVLSCDEISSIFKWVFHTLGSPSIHPFKAAHRASSTILYTCPPTHTLPRPCLTLVRCGGGDRLLVYPYPSPPPPLVRQLSIPTHPPLQYQRVRVRDCHAQVAGCCRSSSHRLCSSHEHTCSRRSLGAASRSPARAIAKTGEGRGARPCATDEQLVGGGQGACALPSRREGTQMMRAREARWRA